MTATTATTGATIDLSPEALKRALREVGLLPQIEEWVVVDPFGRVHKGSFSEVFAVMVQHHPLFKIGAPWPGNGL